MKKKRNRKITVPKVSQIRSVLWTCEREKIVPPNFTDFLKNQNIQETFFQKKNLLIEEILCYIWLSRYEERDLIESGEIEENHPFFKRVLKIMDLNPKRKDEILEFCTLMYFEDNSICEHWNFKDKIDKQKFDNLVCKSIYEDSKSFKLFLDNLTKEEFSNVKFVSKQNPEKPPLDIKSKVMKDVLYSFGGAKNANRKIFRLINDNLNVIPKYDILLQHLDKDSILYYPLKQLEDSKFNNTLIEHEFNGVKLTTTVENLAKFNSMDKGLSECLLKRYGYGLDGICYGIDKFGDMVHHFNQDPFLKTVIVNYLKAKAKKAVKKENKTNWQYFSTLLDLNNNLKSKEQNTQKKTNKI